MCPPISSLADCSTTPRISPKHGISVERFMRAGFGAVRRFGLLSGYALFVHAQAHNGF